MGGRVAKLGSNLFASTKAAFEQVHESLNKELDVVESYLNDPGAAAKAARTSSRYGTAQQSVMVNPVWQPLAVQGPKATDAC